MLESSKTIRKKKRKSDPSIALSASRTEGHTFKEASAVNIVSGSSMKKKKRMKKRNDAEVASSKQTDIASEAKSPKRSVQVGTSSDASPALDTGEQPQKKRRKKKSLEGSPSSLPDEVASSSKSHSKEVPEGVSAVVAKLLRELKDPKAAGSLSDRLNAKHPRFDKALKKRWKLFSKAERAMLVDCDKNRIAGKLALTADIKHPFEVDADDHCETAVEAYRDICPILNLLARSLGKKPATLEIYDPFYCAGAVVNHLGELGFQRVYNKCEDFYAVVKEKRTPPHDVVVTNPPYSGDHVERLLRWCRSNGKPFVLLMPNYFCAKPYYEDALGGSDGSASMLYLYPWKRYMYWTPKGLRGKEKLQGHVGAGGHRTSPFVSFWYIDLAPAVSPRNLLKFWASGAGGSPAAWAAKLCKLEKLPSDVAPEGAIVERAKDKNAARVEKPPDESLDDRLKRARERLLAQKASTAASK